MENPRNQWPDVMIGKAFFNFWDNKYCHLHNRETVNLMSAIYHKGRDQCFYYSSNGQWKSAPIADFPNHRQYVLYRSGKLEVPVLYNVLLPINRYTSNITTKHHNKSMSDNRDLTGTFHQKNFFTPHKHCIRF